MDPILIKKIFLALHIAGGGTALIVGIIPMIAQKGGKLHRRAGWVYTIAMIMVVISAIVMSTVLPLMFHTNLNLFLLFIGVFSGYFVFSGLRGLRFQRPRREHGASGIDYAATGLLLLFSVALLGFSFINVYDFKFQFNAIFLIFALFGLSLVYRDVKRFLTPYNNETHKRQYFFHHLNMMCSSYISAATAFVVVNVHVEPAILVWVGPGMVGGFFVARWVKRYQKKFALADSNKKNLTV